MLFYPVTLHSVWMVSCVKSKFSFPLFQADGDNTPKKGSLDAFVTHFAPKVNREPEKKKQQPEEKKAVVNVADFFDGGAVQRTERNTLSGKRKAVSVSV